MILVYKNSGETMNQLIKKIKRIKKEEKIAYAGRLDPMARGWVPILIGPECASPKDFFSKNKSYQVKVIIGLQTDSDDPLGIIQKQELFDGNISSFLEKYQDSIIYDNIITPKIIEQKYHYFSTKNLNHRRQYNKNKNNIININNINNNSHTVIINKCSILSHGSLNYKEWTDKIIFDIKSIDSTKNFRQDMIINQWLSINHLNNLSYIELELDVSSGFFVRQFIRDISDKINYPLMCFDIHRIKI